MSIRPILRPGSSTLQWNVTSAPVGSVLARSICPTLAQWQPRSHICPHELWIVLDLDEDEWNNFSKFTLRLSWPAYHPTDISIKIYDPASLAVFSKQPRSTQPQKTRRKYARIQLVHTGVVAETTGSVFKDDSRYVVSIFAVLEPLYFGVLPKSVISVVITIMMVVLLGLPVAGVINNSLQNVVQLAKQELDPQSKAKTA
ncbi:hypothetical protein BDZ97DRAFT_1650826 [Flammula alnicola]|nr:hypothetical protein BDZ97DRAFT_1650826 [Flammula alnicola]